MLERSYPTLMRGPIFIVDRTKRQVIAAASLDRVANDGDHFIWVLKDAVPLYQAVDISVQQLFDWLLLPSEVVCFAAVSVSCFKCLLTEEENTIAPKPATSYLIPRSLTGEVFLPESRVDGWYIYGSESAPKRTNDYRTALTQITSMQLDWYVATPSGGRWVTYSSGFELTEERMIVASLTV